MSYDPLIHKRRSIRLSGYDYTRPGAYFITIVTFSRRHIFGEIAAGEMRLNAYGEIARMEWLKTAVVRREIEMDEFVIMPNHIHAIITIVECANVPVGARRRRAPTGIEQFGKSIPGSIPTIIRAYKSAVAARINRQRGTPGAPVWQRNYYDRIVRNKIELIRIREYIRHNPIRWEIDVENRSFGG
jgi:putative transposase